jgi:hypothetical protein
MSPTVTGILRFLGTDTQDPPIEVVVQFDNITEKKFNKIVQERRAELNGAESGAVDVLRYDKEISEGVTLFRVQEIDEAYFSELYFRRGAALIKLRLESFRNRFVEAEEKLRRLAEALGERQVSGKNEKSGFCLGPVMLYADLAREDVSFVFQNKDGLVIGVDVDTYAPEESMPLLARVSRDSSVLQEFKVRTEILRARERSVAGMRADEWLGVGYLGAEEERRFKFMLETKRKTPGKNTPKISLSLKSAQSLTDGKPATQIGNEDMLELWDRIVDSLNLI